MSDSHSTKTITVDGHQIAYITAGEATQPPLIMVHGWFLHKHMWRYVLPTLQQSHTCVALDLLGFGESDKPRDGDYCIPAQAARVVALADHLGIDHFAIMGHSMGGQIAACVAALTAPTRVTHLLHIDGVVTGKLTPRAKTVYYQVALGRFIPWIYPLFQRLVMVRALAYFQFRPWFYKMDTLPFDSWAMDRRLAMQPDMAMSAYLAGKAIQAFNLVDHLPKITAPALSIYGEFDGTVPPSEGKIFAQHTPHARLAYIKDCGHFPMYEKTDEFLALVCDFLASPSP